MWNAQALVEIACGVVAAEERRLCDEQAVHGVESFEEVALQGVLAAGFAAAGFGVLREWPYPSQWRSRKGRRRALPEPGERQRCDLVLLPAAGQRLIDPMQGALEEERRQAAAKGTLFEATQSAGEGAGGAPAAASKGVTPSEAYWLECKVVGQFCYSAGVPGPNTSYASELTRSVAMDLRKLRDDPEANGGVLLVLYTAREDVARADLGVVMHRMMDRGLHFRSPVTAGATLTERIGNAHCLCAIIEPGREA